MFSTVIGRYERVKPEVLARIFEKYLYVQRRGARWGTPDALGWHVSQETAALKCAMHALSRDRLVSVSNVLHLGPTRLDREVVVKVLNRLVGDEQAFRVLGYYSLSRDGTRHPQERDGNLLFEHLSDYNLAAALSYSRPWAPEQILEFDLADLIANGIVPLWVALTEWGVVEQEAAKGQFDGRAITEQEAMRLFREARAYLEAHDAEIQAAEVARAKAPRKASNQVPYGRWNTKG